ncbi:hypothetical protein Srot_1700 [Segniliparus rotundus DSM 44985]|uniref:Uncharacterized protein n=1 Tax=Segniliparus rotundus (strain ATCC BAA-972 / CDC 1076 / CIP 108378 / DSM 44985 / JCM 13578) TaxID=640132 RepID=D6Z880_SEGRD|nr:hypothetical protein [Segniliparus rotundus]ADG98160.1 hypothetical protein Srot_1700 [Segniliparus rotundus DSM 44985]
MGTTPEQPQGPPSENSPPRNSPPQNSGVPQWFYPALGLPQVPEQQCAQSWDSQHAPQAAAAPHGAAPPEPPRPGQPKRWEKALAGCLALACIFLLGWWWGSRSSQPGDSSPLALIGAAAPGQDGLAGLSDDELFALLPAREDYPDGWKVTRTRGSARSEGKGSAVDISPPECDLRKAEKSADAVGSVQGNSTGMLLVEAASAEVRLHRDPRGSGPFVAAEDFAKRCPAVTLSSAGGATAVMRLSTERDTVPGADESMTIRMSGRLQSQGTMAIPAVLTITGARSRGLVVIGSGMRAGLALSLPQTRGGSADESDVAAQLLRETVRRIKAK